MNNYELIIQNGDTLYCPLVEGAVTWDVDRFTTPGKLTFNVINDEALEIEEGNAVRFRVDGKNVFYGFIFRLSGDADLLSITAYDQLRYLKNKDKFIYKGLKADEVVQMVAKKFKLQTGELADTVYKIPLRIEDEQTLIDMINAALDATLRNVGKLYVLYDDFGKIALKDIEDMRLDMILDQEVASDFKFDSSIDSNSYNRIKLIFKNDKGEVKTSFVKNDSTNENKWGILQYFDVLKEGENGDAKATALLKLYNKKERAFTADGVLGDLRVRGGSSIIVQIRIGTIVIQNYMVVDSVSHRFEDNEHFMNLKLRGGDA